MPVIPYSQLKAQQGAGAPDSSAPKATAVPYSQYKTKSAEAPAPKQDGFFASLLKDPLNTLIVKPSVRAGQAVGALGIKAAELFMSPEKKAQTEANLQRALKQDVTTPLDTTVEGTKPFGEGGGKQIAGEALKSATYLAPVGKVAKTIGAAGEALGLGAKVATTTGKILGGAAGTYAYGTGEDLTKGKSVSEALKPDVAKLSGAAFPLIGPAVKGLGRLAGETLGVSTGTGYGAIKEAWNAALQGGKKGEEYLAGLRGTATPESIVNEAKGALGKMIQEKRTTYQQQLEKIAGDKTNLDISPINNEVKSQLDKFGIGVKDGALDFSRSSLRFNKPAQQDIQTIFEEMKNFGTKPGVRTAIGVDSLKRAFGDLYTPSGEARAFVTGVTKQVRKVLSDVPGYDQLSKTYAEKAGLIEDIQKGLSLGDKTQIDTGFRKLTTALRTNNEMRKEFIAELDKASGGYLSSKVSGQQLSELFPRGIIRSVEGAGALASLATGGGILPILKAALFTSPRIVGEIVNALGFSTRQVSGLFDAIEKNAPNLGANVAPEVKYKTTKALFGQGESKKGQSTQ